MGRRIVGWNNEARDTLFLDQMGRVTSSVTKLASGPVWKFSHTYDALDRRTLRSLSKDGSGQSYGGALAVFDGFGSRTTLREGGVNVEFTRTNVSRLPTRQTFTQVGTGLGNWWMGTVFDTLQQMPIRDSFSLGSLNTQLGDASLRDALDRLQLVTFGDGGILGGGVRAYRYDRAGRLLNSCEGTVLACTNEYGHASADAYTYDLAGNRTDPSASPVVGSGNRTTQFGGATYTFNASGQVATKWDGALSWTYGWSALDELKSATASGQSVTYGYDAFGRRVRRTANGTTQYYLHDGEQVAVDLDGSQAMLREYGWRPGVDQLLSVKLADGTTGVAVNDPQLGATVEGLVNVVNGALLADYKNTAWGKKTDAAALALRYRMAGREYDEVTGLYYMRARYYDPTLGKFLSEDPIGIEGGLNLYTYAGDDPVNRRDPSGLVPECFKVWENGEDKAGRATIEEIVIIGTGRWVEKCVDVPSSSGKGGGTASGGGGGGDGDIAGADDCIASWRRFAVSLALDATGASVVKALGGLRTLANASALQSTATGLFTTARASGGAVGMVFLGAGLKTFFASSAQRAIGQEMLAVGMAGTGIRAIAPDFSPLSTALEFGKNLDAESALAFGKNMPILGSGLRLGEALNVCKIIN